MQKDRVDKSAVGWDHHEKIDKHPSQIEAEKGSDGKFGIERRMPATGDEEPIERAENKPEIIKSDTKSLRAKFEQFAKQSDDETQKKLELERQKRLEREQIEKEAARKCEEDRQARIEDQHQQMDESNEQTKDASDSEEEECQAKSPHLNKIGVSVFPMLGEIKSKTETLTEEPTSVPESTEEPTEDAWEEEEEEAPSHIPSGEEGITATALYDYEAAESDEISFNPYEVITHIEMVDEGWWRGMCRGKVGLFPANYVKLNE